MKNQIGMLPWLTKMSITENEAIWTNEIRTLITRYLNVIGADDDIIQASLSDLYMPNWLNAFTSPTYSMHNYESLETIGDSILGEMVVNWIVSKNPKATPSEITSYKSYYAGNEFIAGLSKSENFDKLLRRSPGANIEVSNGEMADMFESIFGAMFTTVQAIVPGLGWSYCRNLFWFFFRDVELESDRSYGDYVTQLGQIGEKLSGNKVAPYTNNRNGGIEATYDMRSLYFEMENIGIQIPSASEFTAFAATKSLAKSAAAKQALDALAAVGITTVTSSKIKMDLDLGAMDSSVVDRALSRLNSEGYVDWEFVRHSKVSDDPVMKSFSLIGIDRNGIKHVLLTRTEVGVSPPKVSLIRDYARGQKLQPMIA